MHTDGLVTSLDSSKLKVSFQQLEVATLTLHITSFLLPNLSPLETLIAMTPPGAFFALFFPCLLLLTASGPVQADAEAQLGNIRVVFQTTYGDIEFGFYPDVAPKTVAHIMKLVRLGGYNTNHFFRVDRGFVAQVADVIGGREAPLNTEQRAEGEKTVPGEFSKVKHVRGILSMGRYSDPDSAGSSFSMLLGNAPHLDGQYAVFGKVTKGDEVLSKLEELPTRKEGIFVMPLQRITILSTYYYDIEESKDKIVSYKEQVDILKRHLIEANNDIQLQRTKCLP